ncbi:class I SAM-dependent methyltransferase [Neoroseomonas lacus]|uniref:DNA methylase N-4/N-6 domain-containing protein n=1 Tax=Neoroseomonas lacus TaxID=287609 RepID=A0A917L3U5_9PROT|nr:hypothetical protein GCM10011320_58270 [Neoroseomonas lacus]
MRRPIENNSSPGQAICEPLSGSGTTLIAAELTGRPCHAIELSPAYVDAAAARWEAFTGQEAAREGDGALFSGTRLRAGRRRACEPHGGVACAGMNPPPISAAR